MFHKKSAFIPLRSVYPECLALIEPHEKLHPLQCFNTSCPVNQSCAEILARRMNYLFTMVMPKVEMIVLYYKYRDRPQSIRGGVFTRAMEEPKHYTLNPYAFKKFQREGIVYQWVPTTEFLFMGTGEELIPIENLVVTTPCR